MVVHHLRIVPGAERRTESLQFSVDAAQQAGDLLGFGLAPASIDRHVSVNEAFMEVRVPIAQDRPLLKDLALGAGYRYSHYSTAGIANTYRFDLQFAPTADVRLRASFDRVVRAPNLIELYTPLSYDTSQVIDYDPCAPLSALWSVTRNIHVALAVNNALDKDPPFLPLEVTVTAGNLNSFPTYDILGPQMSF